MQGEVAPPGASLPENTSDIQLQRIGLPKARETD